jgi:hypothetical protein
MSTPIFRKTSLERLSSPEQLDELMHVTGPRNWLVMAGLGALLAAVVLWGVFGTIPTTATGEGVLVSAEAGQEGLSAILFVSLADSLKLKPGLPVKIGLDSANKEAFGLLVGRVRQVDTRASTPTEVMAFFENNTHAQEVLDKGLLIKVAVDLDRVPGGKSGYKWTSKNDPDIQVQRGMWCSGTITVREQQPISLVFQ